jgi:hypothetical protein
VEVGGRVECADKQANGWMCKLSSGCYHADSARLAYSETVSGLGVLVSERISESNVIEWI